MATRADILPMYPGYAIGSLITENNLMLPLLHNKFQKLQREVEQALTTKNEQVNSSAYKTGDKDAKQKIMAIAFVGINKATKQCNEIYAQIEKLRNEETSLVSVEETLPIDTSASKIKFENRSFQSERMLHLFFTKGELGMIPGREVLQEKVEKFVAQLFSNDSSSSSLPSRAIEGVVSSIENVLQTENQISLVGSFITLPKVMIMDPVKLRRDAKISKKLTNESKNYYVLTGAVLGAVFLGLGKSTSSQVNPVENADRTLLSRLAMISFISQGVIPRPSKDPQDVNLWTVYTQWKEALLDPQSQCGYPIGFTARALRDILIENNISVPTDEKDSKTE